MYLHVWYMYNIIHAYTYVHVHVHVPSVRLSETVTLFPLQWPVKQKESVAMDNHTLSSLPPSSPY